MVFYRLRSGAPPAGRPFKRFKTSKASVSSRLTQLKRQVAQFKPETKMIAVSQGIANVTDTAGAIIYVSGIAQGTDFDDRLGSKVRAQFMELNVALTSVVADTGAEPSTLYAVYLVKDMMSNGSLPSISGAAGSIFQAFSPIGGYVVPTNRDRFKVLRQWDLSAADFSSANVKSMVKWRVPLSGLTEYIDTTAAVTGAQKNAYYVVALSNQTTDLVDFNVNGFFHYTDA